MTSQVPEKDSTKLGRDVQAKIGQQLRAMYADLVIQELPERLRALVGQLAALPKG
jgi:hypothetical protein